MTSKIWYKFQLAICLLIGFSRSDNAPPNIVLIVSDDLGYNDVGYHGSPEIKTPNIDKLARDGIRLENYYVQPICTPTRSQLMSGRYQIHTGLQHGVIMPCMRSGLPLTLPTMADRLKSLGYATHITGKWHLGMFREEYTPTKRGFDSFFGYLTGAEEHFSHYMTYYNYTGLDFYDNLKPHNQSYGQYSAHVFTQRAQSIIQSHNKSKPLFLYLPFQNVHDPLEVPSFYENKFANIKSKNRRIFAGMAAAMDEGIGNITDTLKSSGLWNNTLIVFTNDNGAYIQLGGGNNAPLRGGKYTYFEGGVKGVGIVSGPVIKTPGVVNHQLMHVSDWFSTLTHLAGGSPYGTDGFDMWKSITQNVESPRKEIIFNIDPMFPPKGESKSTIFNTSIQAAYRYKDYKILTGAFGYDGWAPEPSLASGGVNPADTMKTPSDKNIYLFNVAEDPEERNDLTDSHPDVVNFMLKRLAQWQKDSVPVFYPQDDENCNPALHGGIWGPWVTS
ncbi:hypothetical protein EB796_004655 [Bugula neritina]|uniref:Sulfatase N-terminal domain-containing protein n=1 Tax=Bugula neritina TaxID=10212 RepID=A0A7J7KHB0_BUGNE|nr:hypothetical protein EB796_004655 [Bugula neritina]